MICLEVFRNDASRCVAGVPDGTVSGTIRCGPHVEPGRWGIGFSVIAVSGDVLHEWLDEELSVGDAVAFKVVEIPETDSPGGTLPDSPRVSKAMDLQQAREQYAIFRHWMRELEKQWGDKLSDEDA